MNNGAGAKAGPGASSAAKAGPAAANGVPASPPSVAVPMGLQNGNGSFKWEQKSTLDILRSDGHSCSRETVQRAYLIS